MFGALKNKFKQIVSGFSKRVEAEVEEKPVIEEKVELKKKEEKPIKEKKKKEVKEKKQVIEEKPVIKWKEVIEEEPKKKGFFTKIKEKISTVSLSDSKFEEIFEGLEIDLLEIGIAVEVIEKIKEDLKSNIVENSVKRGEIEKTIKQSLFSSLNEILSCESLDLIKKIKEKKPFIICFIGVNGTGKSTTIAKVVNLIQKNKMSCVIAASDTFRAAAIEQLSDWAKRLGVKLISHEYGADPAAVAFDAIKYAEAHYLNVVLIDTAGRLHANKDLMNELKKIIRVSKPDLKIFVGESITGNDCIEQVKEFDEAVGIDAIILSKADVDDKGGAAISVSYVTKKPIIYLGTGQKLEDLEQFDKDKILKTLGLR